MTLQHPRLRTVPSGLVIAETPRVLQRVTNPTCIAAIWERQPLAAFQAWLDRLATTVLPQARLILHPTAVQEAIAHACDQVGTPHCPERKMLEGDIAALAHMFATVASVDYLRLRLTVQDDLDPADVFPPDHTMRLICVYRGSDITLEDHDHAVSVAPGVPIVLGDNSQAAFQSGALHMTADHRPGPHLVLTFDPVNKTASPPALNATTYH